MNQLISLSFNMYQANIVKLVFNAHYQLKKKSKQDFAIADLRVHMRRLSLRNVKVSS